MNPNNIYITTLLTLWILALSCGATGCAGPTTPLGAVWTVKLAGSHQSTTPDPLFFKTGSSAQIHLYPPRQVLHGPKPLTVVIDDPNGVRDDFRFSVRYNGMDVTPAFLRQAEIEAKPEQGKVVLKVPVMRLPASGTHNIEFVYENAIGARYSARLGEPICRLQGAQPLLHTEDFERRRDLIRLVDRIAHETGFSPAFAAALIAQESSFNPHAVSWAKGIGLTQVTSIAEEEVASRLPDLPRFPGINQMSVPMVKGMVLAGSINGHNEWRLDAESSIRGGLAFAKILQSRLSTPENLKKIREAFDDPESGQAKLLLASYNSGYARVMSALSRRGTDWMTADELDGIDRYINRIFSYCDQFSTTEVSNENET